MRKVYTKVFDTKLKLADDDTGQVSCVFSTFDVKDRDGDVIKAGAIKDGTPIRLCSWGHKWGELPVGKGVIKVTPTQAIFEGHFFMDTEAGLETYKTVKNMGDLQEWSWGFSILPGGKTKGELNGERVNLISAVEPFEVSPVLVGSNKETETLSIKAGMEGEEPPPGGSMGGDADEDRQDVLDATAIRDALQALLAKELAEDELGDTWPLSRMLCAIEDVNCFIMCETNDYVHDLLDVMGEEPDIAKVPARLKLLLRSVGYVLAKAATDEEKAAQEERSTKYGIGIKDSTNVTKPGAWDSVPDSDWGDPVNYRYPMPDLSHANNAAARFAQNKGEYTADEQKVVGGRIEKRQAALSKGAHLETETASYADQGNGLLAGLVAFGERTKAIIELREKEGRVLSMMNRNRLASMAEAMKAAIAEIEGLLAETEPTAPQAGKEFDARVRALDVRTRRARMALAAEG